MQFMFIEIIIAICGIFNVPIVTKQPDILNIPQINSKAYFIGQNSRQVLTRNLLCILHMTGLYGIHYYR